jgi:inner membrane protease subunit 1
MRLVNYMRQWRSVAKEALDRTAIVAKFLCLLHVTNNYLCSPTLVCYPILLSISFFFFFFDVVKNRALIMWLQVYGPSMLPTLNLTGDVLLTEHLSPRLGKVGSGDVVLVRSPVDPRKTLTKRVVGMEGDRVTFFVDPLHTDRCQSAVV